MKRIKFKSLSSGSCGNCYWLGVFSNDDVCESGILIDAGVSPRRLKTLLHAEGLGFDDFQAILLTHDHLDHIRSLGSFCKHVGKPVWATPTLMNALSRHFMTGEHLLPFRRYLKDDWQEVTEGIRVRYFEVPHDATQTVGFVISLDSLTYVHITDCGRMTPQAVSWCSRADVVTLESNYDPIMLENGPYPRELQDRIRSGHGHLSNAECAQALGKFLHQGLRYVFLCHLSEHNNTPRLALEESRKVLEEAPPQSGKENVRVVPLPRQTPSPMYIF